MATKTKPKKYHKKRPRKTIEIIVVSCVVLAVVAGVCIYGAVTKRLNKDQMSTGSVPSSTEWSLQKIELPSGYWVGVPKQGERVDVKSDCPECSYLEVLGTEGRPKVIYGVFETKADTPPDEEGFPSQSEVAMIVNDLLPKAVSPTIKGGKVLPAVSTDYYQVTTGEETISAVVCDGTVDLYAATERKNYVYPDGVEFDPESGEPTTLKPDGTKYTKDDAIVETTAIPMKMSRQMRASARYIDGNYIIVWCIWDDSELGINTVDMQNVVQNGINGVVEGGKESEYQQ